MIDFSFFDKPQPFAIPPCFLVFLQELVQRSRKHLCGKNSPINYLIAASGCAGKEAASISGRMTTFRK
jgi:hypothetical protein